MNQVVLDRFAVATEALIVALDAGDADAIETTTAALGAALSALRAQDAWHVTADAKASALQAARLVEAARIRLKLLAEGGRGRIAAVNAIRAPDMRRVGYGRDGMLLR